jgi:hypothetical protein
MMHVEGGAANLVAVSMAEHYGHSISFPFYMRTGIPVTIATTALANMYLICVFVVPMGWSPPIFGAAATGVIIAGVWWARRESSEPPDTTNDEIDVVPPVQNPAYTPRDMD